MSVCLGFVLVLCAGSLDGKIRVWNVLDASVIATVQLHQDMVTAVSFSLSGSRVMAGTMRGRVRFYDLADGKLEYVAQVRQHRCWLQRQRPCSRQPPLYAQECYRLWACKWAEGTCRRVCRAHM